jgi:hypothetical protein
MSSHSLITSKEALTQTESIDSYHKHGTDRVLRSPGQTVQKIYLGRIRGSRAMVVVVIPVVIVPLGYLPRKWGDNLTGSRHHCQGSYWVSRGATKW